MQYRKGHEMKTERNAQYSVLVSLDNNYLFLLNLFLFIIKKKHTIIL